MRLSERYQCLQTCRSTGDSASAAVSAKTPPYCSCPPSKKAAVDVMQAMQSFLPCVENGKRRARLWEGRRAFVAAGWGA